MGKDPRAEANGVAGSDKDSVTLPKGFSVNFLRSSSQVGTPSFIPGALRKVHGDEWWEWKKGEIPAITKKNISMFELTLEAKVSVQNFHATVSALIDTGCRIPILFRTGLVPPNHLVKASRPIKILTADNNPMTGGTHGCKVELTLPVYVELDAPPKKLRCPPLWGYECELIGSDLIIGYPYLKFNRLVVDCPSDKLWHTTLTRSSRAAVPHAFSTSHSHAFSTKRAVAKSQPPAPVQPEEESRRPDVLPGSKAKDPSAQDIRATSSYLAAQKHRFAAADPLAGSAVQLQQVIDLPLLVPGTPTSGVLAGLPSDSSADQGDGACIKSFGTPDTEYKCPHCQRITTQPDYDCCNFIDGSDLLPVSKSEMDFVQCSTMKPIINQNLSDSFSYKNGNQPKSEIWWDKMHLEAEKSGTGLEVLDTEWFQVWPETTKVSSLNFDSPGRQDQTRTRFTGLRRVKNA